ncbi:MAG: universal stress protein [Chloroflexota bacterium]
MYQHILVPLDGSALAECVLPHMAAIAGGCGVPQVTLLRVVQLKLVRGNEYSFSEADLKRIEAAGIAAAREYLGQLVSRLDHKDVKTEVVAYMGDVADSITDYAKKHNVDLVIIATHGRSGISRWVWGSVADRLLRSCHVPVLMVRAPGCVPGI